MDAWESLKEGSTIPAGDAWEHLLAQGGTGSATYVSLADGLEVLVMSDENLGVVDDGEVYASVSDDGIDVLIDTDEIEVEITNG